MKNLYNYINESMAANSTYNIAFNSPQQAIEFIKNNIVKNDKFEKEINEFVIFLYKKWDEEFDGIDDLVPLRFSTFGKYIKLCRKYKRLEDVCDEIKKINKIKDIIVKFGNGSLHKKNSKKIPTDIQEKISVLVFNESYPTKNISINHVKEILSNSEYNQYISYKDWVKAWTEQYNAIISQYKDWKNLKAVHYSDVDKVAECLRNVHLTLTREMGVSKKDSIDPTDIIIYDKQQINNICDSFNKAIKEDAYVNTFAAIQKLYNSKAYLGISLKFGIKFDITELNYDENEFFSNIKLKDIQYDPIKMFYGSHGFKKDITREQYYDICDSKDKPTKSLELFVQSEDTKDIIIRIRTNQAGYRKKLVVEPAFKGIKSNIGKCPVKKWVEIINNYNPGFENIYNTTAKKLQYDLNDLKVKWTFLESVNIVPKNQWMMIENMFEFVEKFENYTESEIYSYYMQINILYALYKSKDIESILRRLILLSEKIDIDCLPYILVKPV